MNAPKGMEVDHINGDPLDNRTSNLRLATTSQNHINKHKVPSNNTSGHIGVTWFAPTEKWHARIQVSGRSKHLGCFSVLQDAIDARKKAEVEHFGVFASRI